MIRLPEQASKVVVAMGWPRSLSNSVPSLHVHSTLLYPVDILLLGQATHSAETLFPVALLKNPTVQPTHAEHQKDYTYNSLQIRTYPNMASLWC